MEWTVLCCAVFAVCLCTLGEPGVSSLQENSSPRSEPAAVFQYSRAQRMGEWLLLKDHMDQGDTLLKERLQQSFSNLKELLKEGDSVLKDQILEGVAGVKEQLKEGDGRLKEELDEDVAWLKDKLAKGRTRMKEELAEGEAHVKEELAEQREALEKLKDRIERVTLVSELADDLKQQMSDIHAELNSTKLQLQTTQTELKSNQESLQSTQETLQSTQADLQTTQADLQTTQADLQTTQADLQTTQEKVKNAEEELQRTRQQLQNEVETSTTLKTQLQILQTRVHVTEDEIHSLIVRISDSGSEHQDWVMESSEIEDRNFSSIGSTFIRWGRAACPDNTSLVYSGVGGGSYWDHPGGASNYLCLVTDPQLSNMTLPGSANYLYGIEYEKMPGGHDNQDVVCCVCRAPQATTLMVPATLTCPPGWTRQYKGHLASTAHQYKGKTEYVCLDEVKEHRRGGHENEDGAIMYHVVTRCGSLPCPPYVHNQVVTCVVCSL